jgi:hypothetical protein
MSTVPRKRRRYRPESLASLAAFMSREKSVLAERPATPRTKPSLAKLHFLDRPDTAAAESKEETR